MEGIYIIIQANCLGLFFNIIVGTEGGDVTYSFQQNIQLFIMLTMMEMTYVIIQGNYALVLWNILVGAEIRRVKMIITIRKFI